MDVEASDHDLFDIISLILLKILGNTAKNISRNSRLENKDSNQLPAN